MTMLAFTMNAQQRFFNLTAEEVRIDSVLPVFAHSFPLGDNYADSTYKVSIVYPEFIPMSDADIKKYQKITNAELPELPEVKTQVVVERKKGALEVFLVPLVKRDGKCQKLVSFMLKVEGRNTNYEVRRTNYEGRITKDVLSPLIRGGSKAGILTEHKDTKDEGRITKDGRRKAKSADERYAAHSVLASGRWAKIQVPTTGVYQLTNELIQKAGFTDLTKVKVYGYGGHLQNETLVEAELVEYDDLKEVPLCTLNGRRLFYAKGPVSWGSQTATVRTRNPYSDYGCYFITQSDSQPTTIDSTAFVNSFYPAADDYHELHEVDDFAWFEGGRNLFQNDPINNGSSKSYTIKTSGQDSSAKITVCLTAGASSTAEVSINGEVMGSMSMNVSSRYDHGASSERVFTIQNPKTENTVTITPTSGGPVRLDYISSQFDTPFPLVNLSSGNLPIPEYVYNITNQDHHADEPVDMIIIIPTTQKLKAQAERLKTFHEQHDGMSVRIVPADELFNEFSSGTPDANAYRRYLKMFYDRAGNNESLMPKSLLLFGDCAWDNRMNSSAWNNYSTDDFLLCFESENSFSSTDCYVNDGFFCSLDDGEGGDPAGSDKHDIAVGRFPVRTAEEAKIMVDKTIAYAENKNAGSWQNVVMFMGDDGNDNLHMADANEAAAMVEELNPGLVIKRVMWDAYTEVATSTGNTYPEVTSIIKQQQANGALIMDYCGHGSQGQISHEGVLHLSDFKNFTNTNLPLWITASCDIAPFDSQTENIGEETVLSPKGGAVAFYGTTRTVYTDRNKRINKAFLRALFTRKDGKFVSLGEAQRIAKNSLITNGADGYDRTINKLQYSLLGDPALVLNIPTLNAVIDSINGKAVGNSRDIQLKALSVANVKGHIEQNGVKATGFNGKMTATVRDFAELITCKMNASAETEKAYTFYDRTKTLFNGTDSVKGGEFSFAFAVTKDISYSDEEGMINIYAVDGTEKLMANGYSTDFIVGGTEEVTNDSIGPRIYCYLNSPSFVNGGNVNSTPFFVAQISDEDGINTTGTGIGHDLELIIDGDMSRTYVLNDYFAYDFGTFTSGETHYSIPALAPGKHTLKFRAWDVKNNSNTASLSFNVVEGLQPNFFSVSLTKNPASESTTFIINHDRAGSELDVEIDIYDLSGRQLWNYQESGVSTGNTYTVDWNLCVDGGHRLQTGVYLYRVRISCDGSSQASRAKKLVVMQ